jgi:hypothetical protein
MVSPGYRHRAWLQLLTARDTGQTRTTFPFSEYFIPSRLNKNSCSVAERRRTVSPSRLTENERMRSCTSISVSSARSCRAMERTALQGRRQRCEPRVRTYHRSQRGATARRSELIGLAALLVVIALLVRVALLRIHPPDRINPNRTRKIRRPSSDRPCAPGHFICVADRRTDLYLRGNGDGRRRMDRLLRAASWRVSDRVWDDDAVPSHNASALEDSSQTLDGAW